MAQAGGFRVSVFVFASLVAACGLPQSTQKRPTPPTSSRLLEVASATLSEESDRERKRLVRRELALHRAFPLVFSAQKLPPKDQKLLATLAQAGAVVEDLALLQVNPQMLDYRAVVAARGDDADNALFRRNLGPWCKGISDVRCCAMRSMPPRALGLHLWPKNMTQAEFQTIAAAPNAAALLSPFTLVRRDRRAFVARAAAQDSILGPHVKRLTSLLRQAAKLSTETSLRVYLNAQASALMSPKAFPFDYSDMAWQKLSGRWEVTVGPHGPKVGSRGQKMQFAMRVGIEDTQLTKMTKGWRDNFNSLENKIASQIGSAAFKGRGAREKHSLRVVEQLLATGGAQSSGETEIAYDLALPAGAARAKPLLKRVVLANHIRAQATMLRQRGQLLWANNQHTNITPEAALQNALWREFCRDLGPRPADNITINGKRTTVGQAMGQLAPIYDELKRSLFTLWRIQDEVRAGKLRTDKAEKRITTALAQVLTDLLGSLNQPKTQAAALLLGMLLEAKSTVAYKATSGKIRIVSRGRILRISRKLTRKVGRILAKGDRQQAQKLHAAYISQNHGQPRLNQHLDQLRLRAKEARNQAKLVPLVLSHQIEGLSATK